MSSYPALIVNPDAYRSRANLWLIEDVPPTLDDLRSQLAERRSTLAELRCAASGRGQYTAAEEELYTSTVSDIGDLSNEIRLRTIEYAQLAYEKKEQAVERHSQSVLAMLRAQSEQQAIEIWRRNFIIFLLVLMLVTLFFIVGHQPLMGGG